MLNVEEGGDDPKSDNWTLENVDGNVNATCELEDPELPTCSVQSEMGRRRIPWSRVLRNGLRLGFLRAGTQQELSC